MGKAMIVRNAMSRPVEIHFANRVVVMLSGEMLRLDEAELFDPGVRPLVQSGALSCFEAPAEPTPRPVRRRKRSAKAVGAEKPKVAASRAARPARKKAVEASTAPAAKAEAKARKVRTPNKKARLPTTPNQTEASK